MLRHPSYQSVDALLDIYGHTHRDLSLELAAEMGKVKGTTARARFLSERLGVIESMIERYRTGIDPLTGEVFLEGPGWQGLVGPDLTNGLAADIAHQAYASGVVLSEEILDAQGVPPQPRLASLHNQAATLLAEELTEKTDANLSGILRKTRDEFRQLQARVTIAEMTKGEDIGVLTTRLVQEFEAQGQKSFIDKRGVEWDLGRYARMLARTVANKAAQQALDNRAAEYDIDLVVIVGGIGDTTCKTCRRALNPPAPGEKETEHETAKIVGHEGARKPIYSRSGQDERYPPLQPLFEAKPPLGHPQCGHQWVPYREAPTGEIDPEELRRVAERVAERMGSKTLIIEEA